MACCEPKPRNKMAARAEAASIEIALIDGFSNVEDVAAGP